MNVTTRLIAFAAALAAVFGVAWMAGAAWGPTVSTDTPARKGAPREHDAHGSASGGVAPPTLRADRVTLRAGEQRRFSFAVEQDGEPVTSFDDEGGVQMHLILVRADLTGYQHLHPELDGERWITPLTVPHAGDHVAFVDFERGGERTVLRTRLAVEGAYVPSREDAPTHAASTDGYDVRLTEVEDGLRFDVTRDGERVELEEYVGARGHLVALHHDDLEYQHVHPLDSSTQSAPAFAAEFRRPGTYRLFLQFKHDGDVHTVAFDREVEA